MAKEKGRAKEVFLSETSGLSHGGQVMAAVGSPSYTGCFVCGSRDHGWQSCPKRSSSSTSSGKSKGVFMVQEVEQGDEDQECGGL